MKITVNNEIKVATPGETIQDLLKRLALTEHRVAVLKNQQLIVRSAHATVVLEDGDVIDIVHAIGGG